jgi:hypothetical protein
MSPATLLGMVITGQATITIRTAELRAPRMCHMNQHFLGLGIQLNL